MSAITPIAPRPHQQSGVARLVDWKPFDSGALIGKATVAFQGGWIVSNIPVFRRADDTLSAGSPDAPLVDANGQQLRDADGKRRYAKIITFENREARERWSQTVLAALRDAGIGAVP